MRLSYLILADLIIVFIFFIRYPYLPPQIPLFYSRFSGEDQLANLWYIFLLPILGNLFVLFNKYIENRFFHENYLIHKIFFFLNLFLTVSIVILFLRIIFLVS